MAGDLSCRSDAQGWLGSAWGAAQVVSSPLCSIFPVNWQRALESAGIFLSNAREGSAKYRNTRSVTGLQSRNKLGFVEGRGFLECARGPGIITGSEGG